MMSMNYPKGIYVLLDHNGGRVFLAFLSDCRTSSLHIAVLYESHAMKVSDR